MKVLIDTLIWSYAFRSKNIHFESHVEALKTLIINQQILILDDDYIQAAKFSN